jgi:hypothetical protein
MHGANEVLQRPLWLYVCDPQWDDREVVVNGPLHLVGDVAGEVGVARKDQNKGPAAS